MKKNFVIFLTLAVSLLIFLAARASAAPLDDAIGYWKFNQNTDDEKNSFTATFDTVHAENYILYGDDYAFDRQNDPPASFELNPTTYYAPPFSWVGWVRMDSDAPALQCFFQTRQSDNNPDLVIGHIGFGGACAGRCIGAYYLEGGDYQYFFTSAMPELGIWTHIAIVFDTDEGHIYFNGVEQELTDSDFPTPAGGSFTNNFAGILSQATGSTDDDWPLIGAADEVAIWNRVLGENEVLELAGIAPPSISFAYPTDTSTILDFKNWSFNYDVATDTPAAYISVYYWDENETQLFNDIFYTASTSATAKHFSKQNSLSLGSWSAYADLLKNDWSFLTTTGQIDFQVVSTSSFISYETASSTCAGYGYFGEPLCLLAFQLFIPSPASLNQFTTSSDGSDLVSRVKTKAPFSYIFQSIDVIENLNASSSPTSSLAAIYSIGSALNGLNINWVLATLLWILLAFWLFHRARHFEI